MPIREDTVEITVCDRCIAGTVVSPSIMVPGVLFVHGWAGNQEQYLVRARELGILGTHGRAEFRRRARAND